MNPDCPDPKVSFSYLCASFQSPQLLTGILRDILTKHFQDGMIGPPELQALIWKRNRKTGLLIESAHNWKPELANKVPAILIRRNDQENQRVSIADRHHAQRPSADGGEAFATVWTGSHTIDCVCETGAQAEVLGAEVQREITQFTPVILPALGLMRLQVTRCGAVQKRPEDYKDNHFVPITLQYAYTEKWLLRAETPKLHKISLSFLLDF